jgi:aminoglycoside phosphotransferase (APT) family kinase protein
MLDQSDIAHYLLSLGLVKPRRAVDEHLTIVDASRRNRVHVATARDGPTYVVKQAGPRSAATLINEAAVLRVLGVVPELAGHVPTVVHHEPDAGRLVLSTPAGARDWSDHHGRGRYPRIPARTLGRTLAQLHRVPVDAVEPMSPTHDCTWGLSLSEPAHALLLDMSAGAQDVVARVQASDTVCRWLEDLRRDRADDAIVHGDLRWDNCLALAATGAARRTRVLLIDWELAGPGTAAFDIGTVLAEYLRAWVWSIPIVDARNPGRLVAHAGRPLWRMRPALQSFWAAYRSARPEGPALRPVVQLAAVRVLQIAVERAERLTRAPAHVVTLLQLADSMLRAPEDAALKLLGLRA